MSKAEELAAQFVELYPQDLGPHHPAKWMMCDFLEQYGRLVQEAAAKAIEETCFYDEYAGLTANDLAESIRNRPLP